MEGRKAENYRLFPPKDKTFYDFFVLQKKSFWQSSELNIAADLDSFERLKKEYPEVANAILIILCFFSVTDEIIVENISHMKCLDPNEQSSLDFQKAMEHIHSETYGLFLQVLIKDTNLRRELEAGFEKEVFVEKKDSWIVNNVQGVNNELHGIVAEAVSEGIHFMSAFAIIMWLRTRGYLQSFVTSNQFIARDEKIHRDLHVYRYLYRMNNGFKPLDFEEIKNIIEEGVDLEERFIDHCLKNDIEDLRKDDLKLHCRVLGNDLATDLGYPEVFPEVSKENLPSWMIPLNVVEKSDFYSTDPTNYQTAGNFQTNKQDLEKVFDSADNITF